MIRSEIIELMARTSIRYDIEHRWQVSVGYDWSQASDYAKNERDAVVERCWKSHGQRIRYLLDALKSSGLALVPTEPTAKMKMAAAVDWDDYDYEVDSMIVAIKGAADCYRTMITAAIKEQEGRD